MEGSAGSMKILDVRDLSVSFFTRDGEVKAVDQVSFSVGKGKTLGIVGESGCGKSVTSLSILRLIASPPGKILGGEIRYDGKDLLKLSEGEMRKIRGREISMVFQESATALNPVFTIGNQLRETLSLVRPGIKSKESRERAIEILKWVGIPSPEKRISDYPHQLSGGMRQRVMIAMAICGSPKILIADEPTTALDVTIQAQILELLQKLQQETGMALILITHDLGVVAEMADEVAVMYAGQVVEQGGVDEILRAPKMPYTQALLRSIPSLHQGREAGRLEAIPGIVPHLFGLPNACRFKERCALAIPDCEKGVPPLRPVPPSGATHLIRCVRDLP